jgi:hypothetical protein
MGVEALLHGRKLRTSLEVVMDWHSIASED